MLALVVLAPGLLLLFCLALLCSSWNQSLRRSPRSARSCPVQLSVEARGRGRIYLCTHCCYDNCGHCVWETEIKKKQQRWEALYCNKFWLNIFAQILSCNRCRVCDLTMFTLPGCRRSRRTRTQTRTFQCKILPCKTRLLLQLALQQTHACMLNRQGDKKVKQNELLLQHRSNIHEVTDCMP